ncbi:hypothetical protein TNCV_4964391 [Trichonephila clavipes]|nr:hypothetical protein TNCV_4964391 [Trichonephila clavipes]
MGRKLSGVPSVLPHFIIGMTVTLLQFRGGCPLFRNNDDVQNLSLRSGQDGQSFDREYHWDQEIYLEKNHRSQPRIHSI